MILFSNLEAGEIDLCEESTNNMKNLASFPCWTRGTDILEPDADYFIVKVDREFSALIHNFQMGIIIH